MAASGPRLHERSEPLGGLRRSFANAAWLLLAVLVVSCGDATPSPAPPKPGFQTTATIEDLMRSMIDPAADAVWDAVVTDVRPDGVVTTIPETTEEWMILGAHAITLAESSNLLLIPGRAVARAGSTSELPGIDLEPEEIQVLLDTDRATWNKLAGNLHRSALEVLEAVETQDVDALLTAGDHLDLACESCHVHFWYPGVVGRPDVPVP